MPEEDIDIAEGLHGEAQALLEARVAALERELAQLRGRESEWRTERARLLEALHSAERELADLPALRSELEATRDSAYWLSVTRSSLTWRLTAPLRAAGRSLRRLGRRPRA